MSNTDRESGTWIDFQANRAICTFQGGRGAGGGGEISSMFPEFWAARGGSIWGELEGSDRVQLLRPRINGCLPFLPLFAIAMLGIGEYLCGRYDMVNRRCC